MYTCSCYDYNNGHVCKHIHRVHSLLLIGQTVQPVNVKNEGSTESPPTAESIEPLDNETDEDHIPGVTITSEGEHSGDTTGIH